LRNVAVSGVGHSEFGVRKDGNLSELTFEAVKPALEEYVANGWTGKTAGKGGLPV
jgi:acetyl-CoA acetyltransferase